MADNNTENHSAPPVGARDVAPAYPVQPAEKMSARPRFPKRVVITGGMPYGNKPLHFAHIGGYFVHADMLARFMRDRIGADNVIFVSGTDCYGSPLAEEHRKRTEAGEYNGPIGQLALENHLGQKETLSRYNISLNLFGGSSIEPAVVFHHAMSDYFLKTLHANGHLIKLSGAQFFDTERNVFLNGRQVLGRCPVEGCRSEKGYADECDLGHQYPPQDLIDPKSTLTGIKPILKEVENWYVRMDKFQALMREWVDEFEKRPSSRRFVSQAIREFLEPPVIYLKREFLGGVGNMTNLPEYKLDDDGKSSSVKLVFSELQERENACAALSAAGIRYRTGKTIVPFRLTGNIDWGVPAPAMDGLEGLTIWVWPESLWAPISFTETYLSQKGAPDGEWKKWWADPDAQVYQFIGQDNIYFYGPAQTAIFLGMQGASPESAPKTGELMLTNLVVSNHILFLNKKASSSGSVKPPMADELLAYYTADQLRAHFLGLGLGIRSVSFSPKPLNPDAKAQEADPVLKEGNLLTNVLNRIARSCFYTAQKYYDGAHPGVGPSQAAMDAAAETALGYESLMLQCEFHQVMNLLDSYIRKINKDWSRDMKVADAEGDDGLRGRVLSDTLHMLRTAAVLVHPVAPEGAEMIAGYLLPETSPEAFFDWKNIFAPISSLSPDFTNHKFKFLEQRADFFKKHESQLSE